jgi:putative ABC transport system permease protein
VQVALSFVLLAGAGLTLRSLAKLQQVAAGFESSRVLTLSLALPFSKYGQPAARRAFFRELEAQVAARPGVTAAALASDVPLADVPLNPSFKIEGRPLDPLAPEPQAGLHVVSTDYFRLLAVPLLEGRVFNAADGPEAPAVAVINRSMARLYWPGRSPLGQRIAVTSLGPGDWRTIVGVVGDVKQHGLAAEAGAGIYQPFAQAPAAQANLLMRTAGKPLSSLGDVRAVVRALDPEQPIAAVGTLAQVRSAAVAPSRLTATLLSLFALVAFVTTAAGVGGVIAFFVSERMGEIGIRSALGASRGSVLALVLRQGMKLVAAGLAAGAAGALSLTRLLAGMLFGVEATDPMTFAAVGILLLAVVGIACLLPAHRALRIDPVAALRG